jgi:signal transduction protein with GAF and PtsI domain
MAGRKPRARKAGGGATEGKPVVASPTRRRAKRPVARGDDKDAEIARLTQALAEAHATIKELETQGIDAFTARKIESLLAAAQVARGQALDASLARSKAEGELRTLEKAITEARGPAGWLLRRAARRVRP